MGFFSPQTYASKSGLLAKRKIRVNRKQAWFQKTLLLILVTAVVPNTLQAGDIIIAPGSEDVAGCGFSARSIPADWGMYVQHGIKPGMPDKVLNKNSFCGCRLVFVNSCNWGYGTKGYVPTAADVTRITGKTTVGINPALGGHAVMGFPHGGSQIQVGVWCDEKGDFTDSKGFNYKAVSPDDAFVIHTADGRVIPIKNPEKWLRGGFHIYGPNGESREGTRPRLIDPDNWDDVPMDPNEPVDCGPKKPSGSGGKSKPIPILGKTKTTSALDSVKKRFPVSSARPKWRGNTPGMGYLSPDECMLLINGVSGTVDFNGNAYRTHDARCVNAQVYIPQIWPWSSKDKDTRPYCVTAGGDKIYLTRGPDGYFYDPDLVEGF